MQRSMMVQGRVQREIVDALSRGRTSGEVIASGFNPSTVYKVQRMLRRGPIAANERRPAGAEPRGVFMDSDDPLHQFLDFQTHQSVNSRDSITHRRRT